MKSTHYFLSVAMFPSPCFYAHFEVSHQKWVMETANFEWKFLNLQKRFYARLRWFLTPCALKNSPMRIKKNPLWDGKTWLTIGPRWSFWNAQAIIKVFLYNCLPELSYMTAFPNSSIHLRKQWLHLFCFVCLLWGRKSFIISGVKISALTQEIFNFFSD